MENAMDGIRERDNPVECVSQINNDFFLKKEMQILIKSKAVECECRELFEKGESSPQKKKQIWHQKT